MLSMLQALVCVLGIFNSFYQSTWKIGMPFY